MVDGDCGDGASLLDDGAIAFDVVWSHDVLLCP